jgi:hypothetical protein
LNKQKANENELFNTEEDQVEKEILAPAKAVIPANTGVNLTTTEPNKETQVKKKKNKKKNKRKKKEPP